MYLYTHFIQRGIPEVTHELLDDDRRGLYNGKSTDNKVRSSRCAS